MIITYLKLQNYKRFPLRDVEIFEHEFLNKLVLITGVNGSGKAQSLKSRIKVPNGWDTMGNMKIGTNVIAKDGSTTKVNGVFPQGKKEIFNVTFSDGRTTKACADHLWKVYIGGKRYPLVPEILTTLEVINLLHNASYSNPIWVDLIDSEQNDDIPLAIDPYILGSNCDLKLIPEEYNHASSSQRLKLIQGLLDTNGTKFNEGSFLYCTINRELVFQIQYLIRSIGGIATMSRENTYYELYIEYKEKPDSTLKLRFSSIKSDGFEETQCISIDHPDKLYVTDDFIVTHNSSLIQELSPLPALKENFNPGGYKEIYMFDNNNRYVLISDFRESTKYSFICNDEELNTAGNITTQRELVNKHFNLTQDLFDILVGNQTFTDMSITHRKKIFNKITHLNIDQILSKFNTLKEDLNNNKVLLKSQLNTYQIESSKLLDDDKLNSLKNNESLIKNNIDLILSMRENLLKDKGDSNINSVYEDFKTINTKVKTFYDKYYMFLTAYPNGDYNELLTKYTSDKKLVEFKLQNSYTCLEDYDEQLRIIELQSTNNIDDLEKSVTANNNSIQDITSKLEIFTDISKVKNMATPLYNLEVSLLEFIHEMPINVDKTYSKDKYETLLNSKNELLKKLEVLAINENKITKEILHLTNYHANGDMECPSCKHTWTADYNKQLIEKLDVVITSIETKKEKLTNELKVVDTSIEDNSNYLRLYRQYINIRNVTNDSLKAVWDKIDETNYILTGPSKILNILRLANTELNLIDTIRDFNTTNDLLRDKIKLVSTSITSDRDWILYTQKEINSQISDLLDQKQDITASIFNLEISRKVNLLLTKLLEESSDNKGKVKSTNVSLAMENIIKELDKELSVLKVSLIEVQTQVSNYNNISYLLLKYDKEIVETKENIKLLDLILFTLSPKHGLIAKTISNYLNSLIQFINSIIGSIWEYKMTLKVIDVENENLDYKFKVQVEDKISVPDISKVSSGMKSVINLSFVLTLYKLLRLENYPLYLDEPSARLDDVHTNNTLELIHDLVNDDNYSQIFLINHKENYDNIRDKEVITLT